MKSLVIFSIGLALAAAQSYPFRSQPHIINLSNEVKPDGSFSYSYQTEDGIAAQAQGSLKSVGSGKLEAQFIQGKFSFTAPDGVQYSLEYTADENGFRPNAAHLPTPPPIPDAILRSIQFNERNPTPEEISGERFIQPRVNIRQ